jgi:hypothetical protein
MARGKLINSTGSSKSNPTGKWYDMRDDVKTFIQGIAAGDLDINQVSSTLISGVPSPWARVKLFWFAFDYLQRKDPNIVTSGLIEFYGVLRDEWKGLLALVALYPGRVSFSDPIYLHDKSDLFNLSGAFGRMLLDDKDFWTNLHKKQTNPDEKPFIQLLKYNNQVIGGTSPFSIFFPGVDYTNLKQASDIPWFRNGKFEDPTRYLDNDKDKTQKLYLFIRNINKNFSQYEDNVSIGRTKNKLVLNGLKSYLRDWQMSIERKDSTLQKNGTGEKYSNISSPFKELLDSQQKVYQLQDGSYWFDEPSDKSLVKNVLSDLQNILLPDKDQKILGWYESVDLKQPLSKSAVYYLQVNDIADSEHPVKYFPLPLSMDGIQMFSQQLGKLVSHQDSMFDISGKITDQGKLLVDLTVKINNQPCRLNSKEYPIAWVGDKYEGVPNNKVMMWPDFISDNWDTYYLYTEYPLSSPGVKFIPFYKQGQDQKIITCERPNGLQIINQVVYSDSSEDLKKDAKLDVQKLINYPVGEVPDDLFAYEVIKSNKPIAGLEIRIDHAGKSQLAGYLIVKNPGDYSMGDKKIIDLTTEDVNREAIIGIDFGSNNSCVNFTLKSGVNQAQPIKFKNRRLALVGVDATDGNIANRDELLFFSNEPAPNGQIKSWLHEHDNRFVAAGSKAKEIAGGVAVNEKNILVKEMDKEKITTQAGILHYNMKWLDDRDGGLNKKTAYLKAVWLSVCADLYANKCRPAELRWSYPSSMSAYDISQYRNIYSQQLPSLTPILDKETKIKLRPTEIVEQTESEAVCRFALTREQGLTSDKLFVGIDVGGSTSDILLLARDITNSNKPKLFKQSSVRIAAGVFFDAVIESNTFRRAIFEFHESQRIIKVENIKEILTAGHKAPFYLNSVFDQLSDEDSKAFYSFIGKEASFVFAIPAFVTGLLSFYSGKLTSKTKKDNNLDHIKEVHIMPFGKGGRLFHWLQTMPGSFVSESYLAECFRKGFGKDAELLTIKYRDDYKQDNKSEVSKGLAVDTPLIFDPSVRFESDIFAEKNIKFLRNGSLEIIDENQVVDSQMFHPDNLSKLDFPLRLENFELFHQIFIDFVGQKSGLVKDTNTLESKSSVLRSYLQPFIEKDAEYKKAKKDLNNFEYRSPIFIAEGLCYLEKILIPELFKS